jgi:HEAT repeat protein
VLLLLVFAVLLLRGESRAVFIGWITGDRVVNGHPKSYWIAALSSEDRITRIDALAALDQMGARAQDAIPELIQLVKTEKDDTTYHSALKLLEKLLVPLGPEAAPSVPGLVAALQDDNEMWKRIWVIELLGKIGPPARDAVPALTETASKDRYSVVQDRAVEALRKIDPGNARP